VGLTSFCLIVLFTVTDLAVSGLAASGPARTVGNQKQLFVDQRFIESSEGITLNMNPPYQTGEKLIVMDQEWEKGNFIGPFCTILREEGLSGPRTRLWYDLYDIAHQGVPGKGFRGIAYAESKDGIHFEKPILDLVDLKGSKRNNLVMPTDLAGSAVGGGSIHKDDNPKCPPGERYKSWSKYYSTPGTLRGENRIWHSPDGLRWKLYDVVPTGLRKADTQPNWFWDSRIGRYIGYSREWVDIASGQTIRMVGYNESDDMLHWENFTLAIKPDELDGNPHVVQRVLGTNDKQREAKHATEDVAPTSGVMDIYGPGVFKYSGAQDIYISLFAAFYHMQKQGGKSWPDTADMQLSISRDGRNFSRVGGRHPFLRLGPSGSFYSKWIWSLGEPIRMGDELWLYYWGTNENHSLQIDSAAKKLDAAVTRAVMRLDGFVSADASYSGGTLTTPPMIFEGSGLELNLDTSAGGVAQVEVCDANGKPIAGYTLADADVLNGNNVRMPVRWQGKGDVSKLAGQAVKLRFKLRDCKLYAFQFQ